MELSTRQQLCLDLAAKGHNVFVTGEAGAGKSVVVDNLEKIFGSNCVIVAPTGVAALNVGGSTIHRVFKFPLRILDMKAVQSYNDYMKDTLLEKLSAITTLIIDEISMTRADVFFAIDYTLRQLNDPRKPFGGVQLIVVGDFQQLPPVVTYREKSAFNKEYKSPYAFATKSWSDANFKCVYLDQQFRQSGDNYHSSLLNQVKAGNGNVVNIFNKKCMDRTDNDHITICTTNKLAFDINSNKLDELEEIPYIFTASITGKVVKADYPTEDKLTLKVGAKALMIVNDTVNEQYVNGDVGTIISIVPGKSIKVELDNGNTVTATMNCWEIVDYSYDKSGVLVKEVVGEFVQLPIKLGYAITIHKVQGKTISDINLNLGKGCFENHQLYVALSRTPTLKGIHLTKPIKESDVMIDKTVHKFYNELKKLELTV